MYNFNSMSKKEWFHNPKSNLKTRHKKLILSKAKNYEELKILRQKESKVLIQKLRNLYYDLYAKSRPQSGLRKSVEYSFKH